MDALIVYAPLVFALAAVGAVAGVIAGLFGIGGGILIVPALYYVFGALGYSDTAMHMAVGTSLATIVATSIRSVLAHDKKDAVDWTIVRGWTPWIVLGAIAGAALAGYLSAGSLTAIFGVVAIVVAIQFIFGDPEWRLAEDMPRGVGRALFGGGIGGLSALMGIGGGVFGVTFMTLCGRPIHQAVGTSAGFGGAIGLFAATGYVMTGWDMVGRAPLSVGYVSIPGFFAVALLTTSLAPFGARLAHSMDGVLLRRLFGILMALNAVNMLRETLMA